LEESKGEKNKMYMKRQTVNKSWPIARKGTKYLIVPSHEKKNGIPILVILRELLKIAGNRKEVKKILKDGLVSVDGKVIKKENLSILPFDLLKIGEKDYELSFSNKGKFTVKETKRKERVLKVVGKRTIKKKKVQLNLLYGKNIITDKKVDVGASVIIAEKKIVKILPVEKGKKGVVFAGKYKGKEGRIDKIENKIAIISYEDRKINVPIKNVMIIK
jgi:small subunit ribosomal protein S4e